MTLENVLKVILTAGSLAAGAFFTALRAKLASTRGKTWLHWVFYTVSGLIIIGCIWVWADFHSESTFDSFAKIVLVLAIVFSLALAFVTWKFKPDTRIYRSEALDPVVNRFSFDADKNNIKLLAGNLDFLGHSAREIEQHPQFISLRNERFRDIQILCLKPSDNNDKARYGKIISDLKSVRIRYYNPENADLKVRGRIKTVNNVIRLLIYTKVGDGRYKALEHNVAEAEGALYSHIWNLIWEIAEVPSDEDISEYIDLFQQQKALL